MKHLSIFILCLLLCGCGPKQAAAPTVAATEAITVPTTVPTLATVPETSEATLPPEVEEDVFVRVADYIPTIAVELKYATADNFTGQVIYDFEDAYLRYGTVKKLKLAQEFFLSQGLSLKIWDAYRPVAAQWTLWEVYPDGNFVADPRRTYSSHSRGNTIDVTLVDSQGAELEMPTGFDDFSPLADRDYSDCTLITAENARLLQSILEQNGFTGYQKEWWHFTDTVSYDPEDHFIP